MLSTVPIRDMVLKGKASEEEVLGAIRGYYLRERCDGLFLTAVSHLGVRLPVERLVRSLEAASDLRFVIIDGAQEFAHVSAEIRNDYCDLYLTGCHKWLQAYQPMGLAFYGRRRSRLQIETAASHLLRTGELNDPLLQFSTQLESHALDDRTETVNLACLFTCQGAVGRCPGDPHPFLLPPPKAGESQSSRHRGSGLRLAASASTPVLSHRHSAPAS
jgi:hypothetical protein